MESEAIAWLTGVKRAIQLLMNKALYGNEEGYFESVGSELNHCIGPDELWGSREPCMGLIWHKTAVGK